MIPKVFFDEAGNTGSNITNREQSSCVPTFPVFRTILSKKNHLAVNKVVANR